MHTYHCYTRKLWKQSIQRFQAICPDRFRATLLSVTFYRAGARVMATRVQDSVYSLRRAGREKLPRSRTSVHGNRKPPTRSVFPQRICIPAGLYFFDIQLCGSSAALHSRFVGARNCAPPTVPGVPVSPLRPC